jgi:uracil-DNA glycosylase family 4
MRGWETLNQRIVACEKCPRLRRYCESVAASKRRAYREDDYWGLPVPNFGDPGAQLLIVGLAPAAHGGNRTGRIFTGDRSGDWLFRALHKAGFANQPVSQRRGDGLCLYNAAITAACHCAPPGNKPTATELANCRNWLEQVMDMLPVRVLLALGRVAWQASLSEARRRGWYTEKTPQFQHAATIALAGDRWLVASFHPSQQNTFTGKLTEPMFDRVFATVQRLLETPENGRRP